jgi:hypothetical protein
VLSDCLSDTTTKELAPIGSPSIKIVPCFMPINRSILKCIDIDS